MRTQGETGYFLVDGVVAHGDVTKIKGKPISAHEAASLCASRRKGSPREQLPTQLATIEARLSALEAAVLKG